MAIHIHNTGEDSLFRRLSFVLGGVIVALFGFVLLLNYRYTLVGYALCAALVCIGTCLFCWALFNDNVKWHCSGRVIEHDHVPQGWLPGFSYDDPSGQAHWNPPELQQEHWIITIQDQRGRTRKLQFNDRRFVDRYPVDSDYPWKTP